jgi:hypothetical protein
MTVVSAGGQVNRIHLGSMDVGPVAALLCCTVSGQRVALASLVGYVHQVDPGDNAQDNGEDNADGDDPRDDLGGYRGLVRVHHGLLRVGFQPFLMRITHLRRELPRRWRELSRRCRKDRGCR